jgi:hypothetical protein
MLAIWRGNCLEDEGSEEKLYQEGKRQKSGVLLFTCRPRTFCGSVGYSGELMHWSPTALVIQSCFFIDDLIHANLPAHLTS